ncbi:bifunctional cobalt-precorrin-7 (C(5))-methyltransferase/cobalt-precorrin-6B (C(15))-methyltransferase [Aestuariimicrobium kwangyangense]|uniref:bifunctional cobalt-precorrin-7 (C(5))-methyltransferase/cobalt-precorrin-6B (C(15))-methyltransferase n=1 Tax=Aestuariimicrobium kwangyangense TaxID=396389 RepID=UPI0003B79651|nr:bifunctional cobalt-precorrin-7 (C(5))-methyltransferase/cobalt-precorrin-6B (C(15))-methyltransferase [Aestuariimicrobium kwangyangense]
MSSPHPSRGLPTVTVVGIGADGWRGLPAHLREVVLKARVVLGGERHLGLVPVRPAQRRITWPTPLRPQLADLVNSQVEGPVVALASGDPLVSGIGSTLISVLGPDRVRIHPSVSSVALARAEMGWPAESCAVVSLVSREASRILRELAPGRRVIALSADETTPQEVAELLSQAGYGESVIHVLGNLGGEDFSRTDASADRWSEVAPRLNIMAIELSGPRLGGWVAGLPDRLFEHDGQLTKRDLRASALARLAPTPGEHLWDVGAGAGSIGIEWMRAHPSCTATAIEAQRERAERIGRNALRLGVPGLRVVGQAAPEALQGLRRPDAVFVGGGATPGVVDACMAALGTSGRLVVHGVTLETERLLGELHSVHGGELTRISVETASPIGSYTGWKPARAVTQWAFTLDV